MRISRKLLTQYLRLANAIIEPRQYLPILATIRLELRRPGALRLNATDLEVHLEAELPVTLTPSDDQTVAASINLRVLMNTIRALPKAQTEVEIILPDDPATGAARIEGMTLVCQSAEDFPPCPDSSLEFRRFDYTALWRTAGAVSHDENRHALNGVLINFETGALVSTDGHRLYVNACLPPDPTGPSFILPRKAIEAAGVASPLPAISVTAPQQMVTIPLKDGRIVARAIEGQFPNYSAVTPKIDTMSGHLEIDPTVLRDTVSASMAISEERNRPIQLDLNGAITLRASSQEHGTFERVMPGTYTGPPMVVGFNGRFLHDAVCALGGVLPIDLYFKNALSPMLLVKDTLTALVMPMQI